MVVRLVDDFDCDFILDEDDEVFNVEGFAGTKIESFSIKNNFKD